jgi:hypothetical protein
MDSDTHWNKFSIITSSKSFKCGNCKYGICIRVKTNKCTNYLFSLLIMYGSSYMLRCYIAILRKRF